MSEEISGLTSIVAADIADNDYFVMTDVSAAGTIDQTLHRGPGGRNFKVEKSELKKLITDEVNVFPESQSFDSLRIRDNSDPKVPVEVRADTQTPGGPVLLIPDLENVIQTIALLGKGQTWDGAQAFSTFYLKSGGGFLLNFAVTLSDNAVLEIPDISGTNQTLALLGIPQVFSAPQIFASLKIVDAGLDNTILIATATDEAADRILIVPPLGGDRTLALLEANQEFTGNNTFAYNTLRTKSLLNSFVSTIRGNQSTGNRTFVLPDIAANVIQNLVTLEAANVFTAANTFSDVALDGLTSVNGGIIHGTFKLRDSTGARRITIQGGAEGANRTLSIPVLGGDHIFALSTLAQEWSAIQTILHGMFKLRDTANDHSILIQAGADEAADRILTIPPMGGNKTLAFLEDVALTVSDEGTPLAGAATVLDFVGAGVAVTGTGATKTITIAGGGGGGDVYTDVENIFVEDQQIGEPGSWSEDNGNGLLIYQENGDGPDPAIQLGWMVDGPNQRAMAIYIDSGGYGALHIGYGSGPYAGGRAMWRSYGMFFGSGGGFGLASDVNPYGNDSDVFLRRSGSQLWAIRRYQSTNTDGNGACMEALNVTDVPSASANSAGWGAEGGEFVMFDSAGNEAIGTPHAKEAPKFFYDKTPGLENIDRRINRSDEGREVQWHNDTRTAKLLQRVWEKWADEGDPEAVALVAKKHHICYLEETAEEYNARNPDDPIRKLTWDQREALLEDRHNLEQDRLQEEHAHLEHVHKLKLDSINKSHAEALAKHAEDMANPEVKTKPSPPVKPILPDPPPQKPERVAYKKQPKPDFIGKK
jgi:hypothetical protein